MTGSIRRRGASSWELRHDAGRDGHTGRRLTRYHSFKGTKRAAELKLAELIAAVGQGSDVAPNKLTVADHMRARIAQWADSGAITLKTAERYTELLQHQIVPLIGAKLVQKLKAVDIETWHTALSVRGRKDGKGGLHPRTIRHAHRLLSKGLREAVRHELVVRNVAALGPSPPVKAKELTILDHEQVKTLIAKLTGRTMYPIAIVALFTGMRRGEILALRWRHIDLDGKQIQVREALEETQAGIRFKVPKTASGVRDVTLPAIVIAALREHRRHQLEQRLALELGKLPDDALLFPKMDGTPQSPRAFSKSWEDVAASISMPDITFHALRHSHASQLIDASIDIVTISRRLGHASPTITLQTYAHLFRKRDDKAAAAIDTALADLKF